MVIVTVWQLSGYMMLIYIAGFTGLSTDVLEAASIDGATGLQKMKSIILPLMVPSFVICLFLTLWCKPYIDRRWALRFHQTGCDACLWKGIHVQKLWCRPGWSTDLIYYCCMYQRCADLYRKEEGGRGIMSRNSKVGGTKRRVLDVVGFTAIIVLFLLYMVPFWCC